MRHCFTTEANGFLTKIELDERGYPIDLESILTIDLYIEAFNARHQRVTLRIRFGRLQRSIAGPVEPCSLHVLSSDVSM